MLRQRIRGHRALFWWPFIRPAKIPPQILITMLSGAFAVVAYFTAKFTPGYMAWPWVWSAAAGVACLSCLASLFKPVKSVLAFAGGISVATSASRSVVLMVEAVGSDLQTEDQRAEFLIAATIWGALSILMYATFAEIIIPWSLVRREARRKAAE